jgi:hypothetical protein
MHQARIFLFGSDACADEPLEAFTRFSAGINGDDRAAIKAADPSDLAIN